jgi:hypothetical protein
MVPALNKEFPRLIYVIARLAINYRLWSIDCYKRGFNDHQCHIIEVIRILL